MSLTAEIKGEIAQEEVSRNSEGAQKYCRMLRDGSLSFADFMVVALLEGLVKVADSTVTSTGVANAGDYDADGADFSLDVPAGYTVMVIAAEMVFLALVDDKDVEVLFMTSNTAHAGTTGTAVTPVNKFGGSSGPGTGSHCTCYVALNAGGGTDVSGGSRAYAFWRERIEIGGLPVAANSEHAIDCAFRWAAPNDGLPAIVAGAGSVLGHMESTTSAANNTHIRVEWIEMPTSWLT